MPNVNLKLHDVTLKALVKIAEENDVSLGQVIRDAIKSDLYKRQRAKRAVRPDERLVAPLRSLLADDLAYGRSWADLQNRLRIKGFAFAESGGGLILINLQGQRICKASELGYSYARLMQRIGRPFPRTVPPQPPLPILKAIAKN